MRSTPSPLWRLIVVVMLFAGAAAQASPLSLYQQRAAYREALDHLTAGRTGDFRRARAALDDYTLAPYLDYYDAKTRLSSLSDAEMAAFQERHGELPAAGILHYRWLKHLGARHAWQRLIDNYQPTTDAELACYHLRALLATGERERALAGVAELWVVGNSQPKACDPLFDVWIDEGHLTEGQVWERLQLAMAANERRLGRYLLRFFEGPLAQWARALYDVHVDPGRLTRPGTLSDDNPYARTVIAHGLTRLARQNPTEAGTAWQRYQDSHAFPDDQAQRITEAIVLAEAREGRFPTRRPDTFSADFVEDMAEAALAAENWSELLFWLERLPKEGRQELRWQYWMARALSRTHLGSERARLTYQSLAEHRNYYGFLAAEQTGRAMSLNPAASLENAETMARLEARPAIRRALELYAVGDLINARREWFALLPTLSPVEQYHAARLAQQVGWVAQGIFTANAAELNDNLELRFPLAYTDVFQRISHTTTVPQPFLLAVARQESAFDPQARSSANARGLMQLLHPTATLVARRAGLGEPSTTDLYDPAVNVALGGHHLARLLDRYGNRRPLAAAAYNAGEGRVDRWIRDKDGQPMDVWIETIPFGETRNYVKNVLAFTQVYSQLLNTPAPMLAPQEAMVN